MRYSLCLVIALLVQCLHPVLSVAETGDGWGLLYPAASRPGTPAVLTVSFSGTTAAGAAPGLAAPEWGVLPGGVTASLQSVQAETRGAGTTSRMEIAFTAQEPGEYEIPGIEIQTLDAAVPSFRTEPFTLRVRSANTEQWLAALAGVVVLAMGGVVYLRQRRRRDGAAPRADQSRGDQIAAKLHEARRYRLDGNFYACYQALSDAAALCEQTPGEDLCGKLRERTRQVGYQGLRPSDDELDSVMREVERASRRVNEEQTV